MKRYLLALVLGFGLLSAGPAAALEKVLAEEFAALSAQTQQAMSLSIADIEGLLKRCERLQEQTTLLEGSEKKVMTKKLRRLCGVYSYVLQTKRAAEESPPGD